MRAIDMNQALETTLAPVVRSDAARHRDFFDQHIAVDTVDYVKWLCEAGEFLGLVKFWNENADGEVLKLAGGGRLTSDNTYNHNEPFTHNMAIMTVTGEDGSYTIALCPHVSGDVRGDYCEAFIVVRFECFEDYSVRVLEWLSNQAYDFELDGKTYACSWTGAGEYFDLCELGGEFCSDSFAPEPWTEDDFLASAKQHLKEMEH